MSENQADVRVTARAIDQAQTLMELGRYERAIPLLATALGESPDDERLHCRLADAYYAIGDYTRSLAAAESALHLNPNSDHAHLRLTWIHFQNNNFDGALKHALEAIRIDPEDESNLYTLAWAEYHSGHSKKALQAAQQAIERDPDNADLHQLIGDLSAKLGKPRQAIAHYREALRHSPESACIHNHLGRALLTQRRINEAAEHMLSAVKIAPDTKEYREDLFDFVHHELLQHGAKSLDAVLAALDPSIRLFYEDALHRKAWHEKLRIGSVATLWLLALLLMGLFFSWITGDDVRRLLLIAAGVASFYVVLFIIRQVIKSLSPGGTA